MPLHGGFVKRSLYHAWLPPSNQINEDIISEISRSITFHQEEPLHEWVEEFKQALDEDQVALFNDALTQVKEYYRKWTDPELVADDFEAFLRLLDRIVRKAPGYYRARRGDEVIGEPVGVPIYLVLDLISNTSAAYTLFTQPSFNRALKTLLNRWGSWLTGPESGELLGNEWFGEEGLQLLESGLGKFSFDETYAPTAPKPNRYLSWDSFFTRKFNSPIEKLRPILPPPESPSGVSYLYNACESTVFRTAEDVQCHNTFWLKTQNYSLYDILGGKKGRLAKEYAPKLIGSSAYQAFLSPADYHRWHVPIEGEVIHEKFDGTYYAVLPDDGAPYYDPDLVPGDPHGAIIRSQSWLNVVATRAVFIITPKDPSSPIELAAFVAIGMVEVSTCDVTYDKGKEGTPVHLKVGDELGTFRFGGSSYTLFVKPKSTHRLIFQDNSQRPIRPGQHRWVNSVIGQFLPQKVGATEVPTGCHE